MCFYLLNISHFRFFCFIALESEASASDFGYLKAPPISKYPNNIKVKNLFSIAVILFLASCSGETITTRFIKNNSEKHLKIVVYRDGRGSDTLNLDQGKSRQLSVSTSNKGSDEEADCVWEIDSAYAKVEGGGVLTKKIQNTDNWDSESEKVETIPPDYENSCTFNIYNSDIE